MEQFLGRKYVLEKNENYEEVMKALGVGLMARKMENAGHCTIELTKKGDTYTLRSLSTFKENIIKFKLGQEFSEETADERKVKSTITQDGNKLIHIQKGEKKAEIIRVFTDEEMQLTMKVDDLVCHRLFKAQEGVAAAKC